MQFRIRHTFNHFSNLHTRETEIQKKSKGAAGMAQKMLVAVVVVFVCMIAWYGSIKPTLEHDNQIKAERSLGQQP